MENTKLEIRIPKVLAESIKKKMAKMPKEEAKKKVEELKKAVDKKKVEEVKDEKITISLNEYVGGSDFEYQVGKWAVETFPKLAKAAAELSSSDDKNQQLVDLGSQIIVLATVGSVTVGIALGIFKDNLIKAAKSLKAKAKALVSGKKEEIKETEENIEEGELDLSKAPKSVLAKLAK
jgi:hypothetical protein